jgi:hypothetical protein
VSKDLEKLIEVISISLGVGVVGSILSVAWYRVTARGELERDTIYFLIKLFFGISAFGIVGYLIAKYL